MKHYVVPVVDCDYLDIGASCEERDEAAGIFCEGCIGSNQRLDVESRIEVIQRAFRQDEFRKPTVYLAGWVPSSNKEQE